MQYINNTCIQKSNQPTDVQDPDLPVTILLVLYNEPKIKR